VRRIVTSLQLTDHLSKSARGLPHGFQCGLDGGLEIRPLLKAVMPDPFEVALNFAELQYGIAEVVMLA
jgi:hypothetical protein